MTPEALSLLFIVSNVLFVTLGYVVGHRRGVDAGWCTHHFESIAKDRARRDARGQFKSTRASAQRLAHGNGMGT